MAKEEMELFVCDPRKQPECAANGYEGCWYYGEGKCCLTNDEEASTEKTRWQILAELHVEKLK